MKKPLLYRLARTVAALLILLGIGVVTVWSLCFTAVPWRWYNWLACRDAVLAEVPEFIVVLGGGGIPSESGLMRSYAAAQAALRYPNAMVVVAMPDPRDPSTAAMFDELVLRGVDRRRLLHESQGRNTWEQARALRRMLAVDGVEPALLLVTSVDHTRRSLGALRKAGFREVGVRPADTVSLEADLGIEPASAPQGRLPAVGSTQLRYGVWNNFGMLNRCVRESVALLYYRFQGWN